MRGGSSGAFVRKINNLSDLFLSPVNQVEICGGSCLCASCWDGTRRHAWDGHLYDTHTHKVRVCLSSVVKNPPEISSRSPRRDCPHWLTLMGSKQTRIDFAEFRPQICQINASKRRSDPLKLVTHHYGAASPDEAQQVRAHT